MPVGDCQRAFAAAAAEDGIDLSPQSFTWLCQQGHLALPGGSGEREALAEICLALGGDEAILGAGRSTRLRGDFFHEPTRTLIEIDEAQHFTSARLRTLDHYPDSTELGFDLDHYKKLCRRHRGKSDDYRATKEARGFAGPGGRTRQRAYYDALRDLAAAAMGYPPLVRIEALHDNGRAAFLANRDRLLELLS